MTHLDNLFFVLTHSAYLRPTAVVFAILGFWLGYQIWGKWAKELSLQKAELKALEAKIKSGESKVDIRTDQTKTVARSEVAPTPAAPVAASALPKGEVAPVKLDASPPMANISLPKGEVVPVKLDASPPMANISLPKAEIPHLKAPNTDIAPPKTDIAPPKTDIAPPKADVGSPLPKADVGSPPPKANLGSPPPKANLGPPPPKANLGPPPPKANLGPPKVNLGPPKVDASPPKTETAPPKALIPPPKTEADLSVPEVEIPALETDASKPGGEVHAPGVPKRKFSPPDLKWPEKKDLNAPIPKAPAPGVSEPEVSIPAAPSVAAAGTLATLGGVLASKFKGEEHKIKIDEEIGVVYHEAPDVVDDLTEVEGIDADTAAKLNESGIYTIKQIESLDKTQRANLESKLGLPKIDWDSWKSKLD